MTTEQKILILAISAAFASVLITVSYNIYVVNNEQIIKKLNIDAYNKCLANNKKIAEDILLNAAKRGYPLIIPTCYLR
jgi:hypothetical protein